MLESSTEPYIRRYGSLLNNSSSSDNDITTAYRLEIYIGAAPIDKRLRTEKFLRYGRTPVLN